MKLTGVKLLLICTLAAVPLVGCDVYVHPPAAEVEVNGAPPPPPAQVDIQAPSPGPDYVWIGGNWVWGPGGRWEWEHGRWGRPPHVGAVWVPHRYVYRNGRHVWVRGGWH